MQNTDQKPIEAAKDALKLIEEIDQNYTQQVKKMRDPEIAAVLEAIKMFHESNEKKLKDYINAMTSERPVVDG